MKIKWESFTKGTMRENSEKNRFYSVSVRELYPSLEGQLKEFRKHLVESTNEMAPLKVWQLQGNGGSAHGVVVLYLW